MFPQIIIFLCLQTASGEQADYHVLHQIRTALDKILILLDEILMLLQGLSGSTLKAQVTHEPDTNASSILSTTVKATLYTSQENLPLSLITSAGTPVSTPTAISVTTPSDGSTETHSTTPTGPDLPTTTTSVFSTEDYLLSNSTSEPEEEVRGGNSTEDINDDLFISTFNITDTESADADSDYWSTGAEGAEAEATGTAFTTAALNLVEEAEGTRRARRGLQDSKKDLEAAEADRACRQLKLFLRELELVLSVTKIPGNNTGTLASLEKLERNASDVLFALKEGWAQGQPCAENGIKEETKAARKSVFSAAAKIKEEIAKKMLHETKKHLVIVIALIVVCTLLAIVVATYTISKVCTQCKREREKRKKRSSSGQENQGFTSAWDTPSSAPQDWLEQNDDWELVIPPKDYDEYYPNRMDLPSSMRKGPLRKVSSVERAILILE